MNGTLFLRAHIELLAKNKKPHNVEDRDPEPTWPDCALVFDCETRIDEKQSLTFGVYRVCCWNKEGQYGDIREEGIFYDPEELTTSEVEELLRYVDEYKAETGSDVSNHLRLRPRSEFLKQVFFPLVLKGALVVGFNLPFDISRLAADAREARRLNDDWSFVMLDEPFCPRIVVTRKDGKIAFFRLSGVGHDPKTGKKIRIPRGRFLDLRTLAWALRNVPYTLDGSCNAFHIPGKLDHKPTGKVTRAEIDYGRQDIRATVGLLNALRAEFDRYPINLEPDRAYSPASIAKAYFGRMGIVPPPTKFRLSPKVQGVAAQAFYGGRAECRIRHTLLPVVHTDFKSEYPTVITLMGLWRLLTAHKLKVESATKQVRHLLETLTLEAMFECDLWKQFTCFALIQPDTDILPVRAEYRPDSGETNVGVNYLSSGEPIWYALPDLIASKLLTGKSPRILEAFRVVPWANKKDWNPLFGGATRLIPVQVTSLRWQLKRASA